MSYPYPQDRRREQKEKGEQPYKDAREAMARERSEIETEEQAYGAAHQQETPEERAARMESELAERLREVNRDLESPHAGVPAAARFDEEG